MAMHSQYMADMFVRTNLQNNNQVRVELKLIYQVYCIWLQENHEELFPSRLKRAAFYARVRFHFNVLSETTTANGRPLTVYSGIGFVDPRYAGYNLWMHA